MWSYFACSSGTGKKWNALNEWKMWLWLRAFMALCSVKWKLVLGKISPEQFACIEKSSGHSGGTGKREFHFIWFVLHSGPSERPCNALNEQFSYHIWTECSAWQFQVNTFHEVIIDELKILFSSWAYQGCWHVFEYVFIQLWGVSVDFVSSLVVLPVSLFTVLQEYVLYASLGPALFMYRSPFDSTMYLPPMSVFGYRCTPVSCTQAVTTT